MTSETDEQFLERLEATPRYNPSYRTLDSDRLFDLARRGAAVQNHGQDAKLSEVSSQWRPISEAPKGFTAGWVTGRAEAAKVAEELAQKWTIHFLHMVWRELDDR